MYKIKNFLDNDDIKALFKDGILTISFPKEDIKKDNNYNNIKLGWWGTIMDSFFFITKFNDNNRFL